MRTGGQGADRKNHGQSQVSRTGLSLLPGHYPAGKSLYRGKAGQGLPQDTGLPVRIVSGSKEYSAERVRKSEYYLPVRQAGLRAKEPTC